MKVAPIEPLVTPAPESSLALPVRARRHQVRSGTLWSSAAGSLEVAPCRYSEFPDVSTDRIFTPQSSHARI